MELQTSALTANDLTASLTGDPEALNVHLTLVERDIEVDGHLVKVHCHCLAVDGNGRVQPLRLAQFMRGAIADYAIPRSKVTRARDRDQKYKSTEAVAGLLEEARRSFTDLAKTGEGGEMLLFLLAERFLGLPQILCKMDLKTDSRMHYHGADGVYASITEDGMLKLYWGESKIYKTASEAIKECFSSLGAYLLATYLREGSIKHANFAKRHSPQSIDRLNHSLAALASKIEIRSDVADRHPGVSALGLQRLLEAFRAYQGDVENLLPASVDSHDSYNRFMTIMRRINKHLYTAFVPEALIPVHALIVVQWLKGLSLAAMIRKNIEYHREVNRQFKLPLLIRETMEFVEQTARFRAPKYFSAYMDILHVYLLEQKREDLIDGGLDIGTQLEFGVSTKTLLALMEIGLSRMSAVALYEKIARDDLTRQECLQWIDERKERLDSMNIPAVILREIEEKLLERGTKPPPN